MYACNLLYMFTRKLKRNNRSRGFISSTSEDKNRGHIFSMRMRQSTCV